MKLAIRCHQGGWSWPQVQAVWREADALGYDGATLYDLLGPGVECWTALTALLATCPRLTGIPLVLANPYRPPALMAKMAATLDRVTGGRLILGLGSGGSEADARAHGLDWRGARARAAALAEAVQAMRALWAGGKTFAGAGLRLSAGSEPAPFTPGGPPVLIGGRGRRHLLRVVGRVADSCNIGFDLAPEGYAPYRALLADYCREAGRDPSALRFTHNATVLIAENGAAYEQALARWSADRDLTVAQGRARLASALAGPPDAIAERLEAYRRAGFAWTFLVFQDLPRLEMTRLFAQTVLPLLAQDTASS
ncbi:MAG TPA: LLM class flavin-dependent oxidoreductase [Dehalococcoidia bacterium]|nr:LLM class flavin-dependent oxidoreductase [Dehalococcoidia bacterium]